MFFGKKKEKACNCEGTGENCNCQEEVTSNVKVLGSGCSACNQLEAAVKEALAELGMETSVEHVKDFAKIAEYGVMSTPALVIDDKVVSSGKVLTKKEALKILSENS